MFWYVYRTMFLRLFCECVNFIVLFAFVCFAFVVDVVDHALFVFLLFLYCILHCLCFDLFAIVFMYVLLFCIVCCMCLFYYVLGFV